MSLLGIDVGTTGCKALVITEDGESLAQAQRGYEPACPEEGACELDCPAVWGAVREAIAEVAGQTQADPVRALSVTSMGDALVGVSAEGRPQGPCLLGPDRRGSGYLHQVEERLGAERLYEITGHQPALFASLPKLCWLRDNRPAVYERTWRFMPWSSLVAYLLGGSSQCDYSQAGRTLLLDLFHERWSAEVLAASGLRAEKLPELGPAGTPIGTVSAPMARELGLPSGVRMVLGGHDLCCNALGAGCSRSGLAALSLSHAFYLTATFQAVALTSLMRSQGLNIDRHVVPGVLVSHLYSQSGGSVLRWFVDQFAPAEKREAQRRGGNVLVELLAEMPDAPTELLVLPDFAPSGPPRQSAGGGGAMLGLHLGSTRGEIVRALLEGLLSYLALGQENLAQAGIRLSLYRATGGGARLDRLLQLAADILGLDVERPGQPDAAALGAALLAGVGTRIYANTDEAVEVVVRVSKRYMPHPAAHSAYLAKLGQWRELYALLRGHERLWHSLST